MKKVLIIIDHNIPCMLIQILMQKYYSNNYYIIIGNGKKQDSTNIPSTFKFYDFDPTSESKLSNLITNEISHIFIIKNDTQEISIIYKIIRKITSNTTITITCSCRDYIDVDSEDRYLNVLANDFIMASKLIEKMPNIPLIARGIGLNRGEIMQINVPFGSAFSYINIGSIRQKGWRIIGIYRQNDFLLSKPSMMIQPNDDILVAGEPIILNNIYKKINTNKGNFPAPFGIDIHAYVDFNESIQDIDNIISDSLWIHKKIKNNKLIINIINPCNINKLSSIKKIKRKDVVVMVDYGKKTISQKIQEDSAKKVGLIIINPNSFKKTTEKKILYKANSPILKLGKFTRLDEIEETLILLSEHSNHMQNISYTIIDIASQLNYEMKLYEFEINEDYDKHITNYYKDLSKMFNKKIYINQTNSKNPILWLFNTNDKFIQFIPFELRLLKKKIFSFLSKDIDYLSININKNPQILIPY